jgi:glycosyltransferase involved in cell wall biosynthesis
MDNIYLVMPAYNEGKSIESVVAQWYPVVEKIGNDSRLLIVNDGSTDDTSVILAKLQEKYPLLLTENRTNGGHGATIHYAYRKAIEAGVTYVFQTDSDGQTDPNDFWVFWENRKQYDFLIGLRSQRQEEFIRILATWVLRVLLFFIFGKRIKDPNTPFRLMKTERLSSVLKHIPENLFLCNVAISAIVVKWNEKSSWLPIRFDERHAGVSSIQLKHLIPIAIKAIYDFNHIRKSIKNTNEEKP